MTHTRLETGGGKSELGGLLVIFVIFVIFFPPRRVFISTKTILKTSNFVSYCTSCVVHRYDGGMYMKYQNLVNNDSQVILIAWRKRSACDVCAVMI